MSLTIVINVQAQVVYEPLDQSIYSFLQRMYVRGLHSENLEVTPISRIKIADCLNKILQGDSILNIKEKEELSFYSSDFDKELRQINNSFREKENLWHLYNYSDTLFSFVVDPVLGISISKGVYHRFNGAKLYGEIGELIGFSFHFHDNLESGENIDETKANTSTTGINIVRRYNKNIEYSDIRAMIGTKWKWGSFAIGKDYVNWGMGQRSKLILSSKAPSFPFIRLDINPTDWLRFYYMHGWLQSDILDSSRSYNTRISTMQRNIFREKYIATHLVSVSLLKNLNISFGESIIYSDMSPNLLFLNPLLFYRAVDHYLTTKEIGDGNNSQIFFNADYRAFNAVEVYGSLFIDEINTDKIFNDAESRNQLGYTFGLIINSPVQSDLTFITEYTKILPWVYSNFVQTQTYESDGNLLGHYIGQNADQVYLKLEYRIKTRMQISLFYDYIRNGGLADIHYQYQLPSLKFLYGYVSRNTKYGIDFIYEPLHDLRFGIQVFYNTRIKDKFGFALQASYGLF